MARLISFSQLTPKSWKNGGGSTTELAIYPPTADYDSFMWRISLATISEPGPFSLFPGIDRTLALLQGAALTLTVEDQEEVRLTPELRVYRFIGERKISATIPQGPTTDFNVMTRRDGCRHTFRIAGIEGAMEVGGNATWTIVFLASGDHLTASLPTSQVEMRLFDVLVLEGSATFHLTSRQATVFLVSISSLS